MKYVKGKHYIFLHKHSCEHWELLFNSHNKNARFFFLHGSTDFRPVGAVIRIERRENELQHSSEEK